MTEELSLAEARSIALAAQGFDRPRPRRVTIRDVASTIRRLALVQLDYVNLVVPSHYQVIFSRLGRYDRSLLDELVYGSGEFTEQWAHEASIVPVETWPLLRYRRDEHRARPWGFDEFLRENPVYVTRLLEEVRTRGPLRADELPETTATSRALDHAWFRSIPRAVLEAHFGRGTLAVAKREGDFARRYDLAERLIPPEHHARTVGRPEAHTQLLMQAARAHGVGTLADLADYFRMPVRDARPRLEELTSRGALREVRVEGWRAPAYLHPQARPAKIDARALLSPFDPVVWFRPRTARLFAFDYRFEIFVPGPKRRWGAYVLPFLMGDRLVARVDLKSDRARRRLAVLGAWLERGADRRAVASALVVELHAWADWLGLEKVVIGRRGDLTRALGAALRA
ncbi:MAG TPA: crosslink repair DNA glycosylase YcaQ family protein [Myxococcales bacterium]|nr:crosslink repair DNA glycosylase YcaQ family protein [Myxococcales bacterium]